MKLMYLIKVNSYVIYDNRNMDSFIDKTWDMGRRDHLWYFKKQ